MHQVIDPLTKGGFECYLVGGSVRDMLLGYEVYDYDFATNAHPETVMRLFRKVVPTGIKHGTVSVIIGQRAFEVTTYRSDGTYIDGRRPETVLFSQTLEEDVKRRDFTINGLAYDLDREVIIDYIGGLQDIEEKVIRTIGDPIARFNEDGLRAFRACRFAAKLNFKIDPETFNAIKQTLEISKMVSIERIREELMKLLDSEKPSVGIEYMRTCGLLQQFLPELADSYDLSQNRYHKYDIYYHSIYSCDGAKKEMPIIRLAALLHDIGKTPTRRMGNDGDFTFYNHEVIGAKMANRIMKRLKFSNEDINHTINLVANHMFHYTDEWTDGAVRRFMRKVGMENIDDLFYLRIADRKGNGARNGLPAPILKLQKRIEKIIDEQNAITVRDLNIDGHVIMQEFNLTPGPIIGKVLNELLEMVLDNPDMNTKEILLAKARDILNQNEKIV